MMKKDKTISVAMVFYEGIEVLDFAGPFEVFDCAGFQIQTVGRTKDLLCSQEALYIRPEFDFEDIPEAEILAVFGGKIENACKDEALISFVQKAAGSAKVIFSVCNGAMILAEAGLLKKKQVTTYKGIYEALAQAEPEATVLQNVRFVQDGNLITTSAVSAGIDGALRLVEWIKGKEETERIAEYIEYKSRLEDGVIA